MLGRAVWRRRADLCVWVLRVSSLILLDLLFGIARVGLSLFDHCVDLALLFVFADDLARYDVGHGAKRRRAAGEQRGQGEEHEVRERAHRFRRVAFIAVVTAVGDLSVRRHEAIRQQSRLVA